MLLAFKHFSRALWAFSAFAFATIADPMGLTEYTKTGVHKFVMSLEGYSKKAQRHDQKIVVILLDDEFLRESALSYPVPHWLLADLVASINDARPKAIYLHFSFGYDRQDAATDFLGNTLRDASQSSSIFIAAANQQSPEYPILSRLKCSDVAAGCPSDQIPFTLVSDNRMLDASPMTPYETTSEGSKFSRPAPRIACALVRPANVHECEANMPRYIDPVWPAPPPVCGAPTNSLDVCEHLPASAFTYAAQVVIHNILGDLSPVADPNEQLSKIYPFTTIGFDVALSGSAEVEELLHDSIVLVGFESPAAGGYVQSPNYGPSPGVFLEAAALDTILSSYMTPPLSRNPPDQNSPVTILVYGAIIFVAIALSRIFADMVSGGNMSRWLRLFQDTAVAIFSGVALIMIHHHLSGSVSAALVLVFLSVPIAIITDLIENNPHSLKR